MTVYHCQRSLVAITFFWFIRVKNRLRLHACDYICQHASGTQAQRACFPVPFFKDVYNYYINKYILINASSRLRIWTPWTSLPGSKLSRRVTVRNQVYILFSHLLSNIACLFSHHFDGCWVEAGMWSFFPQYWISFSQPMKRIKRFVETNPQNITGSLLKLWRWCAAVQYTFRCWIETDRLHMHACIIYMHVHAIVI